MSPSRRRLIAASMGALAAPSIARAQAPRRWRCVTSWAKNLPGPGVTAARLAKRISEMSAGELTIEIFAAGEIVPALNVFDAVSNGTVEMGHTASLFWQGKMPAAGLFTTQPFGLVPTEHAAWIDGGGQALWDELYAPHGVRGILAGNTGPSSAGWFRKPIASLADLKGLRIRVTGLGGEIYSRLGATPIVTAPADTYPALERGVIDAAEFLAPGNDAPLGLNRVAPQLAFPGFNKPNGASEALVSLKVWNELPAHLRAIVEAAAQAEHDAGLADAAALNNAAINTLLASGTQLLLLPDDVLEAARKATGEVLDQLAGRDALSGRIVASFRAAQDAGRLWRRVGAASAQKLL
jgi:TRAP-type mannitol/chloroaromatic compound transport system substrate-binding protein